MRRVYFTESQVRGMLGEDFMTYLPKETQASETPENSYGTQTATSGKIDGELTNPVCTDRVAKERMPAAPFGRRHLYAYPGTGLYESNQDLENTRFNLGRNLKDTVVSAASNDNGDKLLNNMAKEAESGKGFSTNSAYKRLHDLETMRVNDPERFKRINGNRLMRNISSQLEAAKGVSKRSKELKKDMGMTNAFQKAGGIKQSGNGQAHTKKNGNAVFTYQN